jgi:hypothetical protein
LDERLQALSHWLSEEARLPRFDIEPASGDASFRRYFRVRFDGESRIAMDAPPGREDVRPFVAVANAMGAIGLHVPQVLEADVDQGFLLLSDLGTRLYLDALGEQTVDRLYGDALGALASLQACGLGECTLPPYDRERLRAEMELFRDWYLGRHLGLTLSEAQNAVLDAAFQALENSALEQPVVAVHRDYHSRNLMVTDRHNPGILDFQDAVMGPVTYDLVSLLRDCYIAWPRERVEEWALGYHDLAVQSGVVRDHDEERFLTWFDLMGVQRHLKAIGIFSRLNYRDHKPGYLKDIPRTLDYVLEVSARHRPLASLHGLLQDLAPAG